MLFFLYDENRQLYERRSNFGSALSVRTYHYEDEYNATLLTGITDERGIRFASWAYDKAGRAISSQPADAGMVRIAYQGDQYRVVTNELGKETTYRYGLISGINRLVEIKGEPTPDCPASNSSYTYNERGLVLTKTDAKGLITTYGYNDRGLEISRTEASGTTLARTVTTEWDPDRFLPIRVTEPDRITTYSYDVQGRELSRQTTSR
ncbi:RHS repeat protein [Pseudomonas alliivorans]|nr:RHS repeat protein [Pseudomonas alliivorans]